MDNMGRNIRGSLFTISGYMTFAIDVIKEKYKSLLAALIPLWLIGFIVSYSQSYLANQYEKVYFDNVSYNVMRFPLIVFLLAIITIFLQFYLFGVIYIQSRAYIDNRDFTIKDAFIYISKRFGSFITNILAIFLLILGAVLGFLLYAIFAGMISASFSNAMIYGPFDMTFNLILTVGSIAFIGLVYFFLLKFYFSSYVVLNYQYGGFKALGYSNFITKGFKGKMFGYILLFIAVALGIQLILYSIFSAVQFGSVIFTTNVFYSVIAGTVFSLITTVINSILNVFLMIYMSGVFINIDSIKQSSPYLNNELLVRAQDKFEEYCVAKNISSIREEDREPNIIE